MGKYNLMTLPADKRNLLEPCVKYAPAVMDNGALRYVFEMPNCAEVVVDSMPGEDHKYTMYLRPPLEPKYIYITKEKKLELKNLTNETAIGLLEWFYNNAGGLKPEKAGVYAISGDERFLKSYLMCQPYQTPTRKVYIFSFPNGYTAYISHILEDGTFKLSVSDSTYKGMVDIGTLLGKGQTVYEVVNLNNMEANKLLKVFYSIPKCTDETIFTEMTYDYFKYFMDSEELFQPDFEGYLRGTITENMQELYTGMWESTYEPRKFAGKEELMSRKE